MSTLKQETTQLEKKMEIQSAPSSSLTSSPALPEPSMELQGEKTVDNKTYSRRILLHTSANAQELATGKFLKVSDAERIFRPDFAVASEGEQKDLENCDLTRGIVSRVEVMSVYSNCDKPVVMGLKLFQRPDSTQSANTKDLKISNDAGWLYSCAENKLGEHASHGRAGVTNIFSIMPFERTRVSGKTGQVVYSPSNLIGNRYISQYGSYNWRSLWDGIVQFPNEDFYYLDKNHIVIQIVQRNWELLGIPLDQELPREGRYYRIDSKVCDRVISELYDNVISKIPFTKWENMGAVFSSDHIDETSDKEYNISVELRVSFSYPGLNDLQQ
tara:strand:+ start:8154 stop:9140 length:987 start_codon:yes stop_codon:yes gene_type:complete